MDWTLKSANLYEIGLYTLLKVTGTGQRQNALSVVSVV